MLIECDIPELDNIVTVGAAKYHFTRASLDRSTPMLCDVVDTSHAEEILTLPGFHRVEDDAPLDPVIPATPGATDGADPQYANMTYDELRELYTARFGKAAHPQAKFETLVARLSETKPVEPQAAV